MITDEQYDQMDAYLFGQMTEEEQQNFETTVQQDEELAAALAVQRLEHAGMKIALQNDLKAQLKNWQQELPQESSSAPAVPSQQGGKIRSIRWQVFAAAASVLLVLGFVGQRWANGNYGSAALMYDMDNWSINTRGASSNTSASTNQALIDRANQALQNKDYKAAMQVLEQVDTAGFDVYVLRAGAQFGLKAFPKAAENLQLALNKAGSTLAKQEVEWKLVMTYIASNEDTKAKNLLQQIANNPDHDYAEKAKQTLIKLNSPWRKIVW